MSLSGIDGGRIRADLDREWPGGTDPLGVAVPYRRASFAVADEGREVRFHLAHRSWDVSADGQRFLLARMLPSTDKPATVMHVVLNWQEELKRLVPAK